MIRALISSLTCVAAIVALGSVSVTAVADDRDDSELSPGQMKVAHRIAQNSDFSIGQLQDLRSEGLGWGNIEIATILSEKTEVPLSDLIELWRTADKSWGIVAAEYGFENLGALISERKRRISSDTSRQDH